MIASAQNDLAIFAPTASATQTLTVKTVNYEVVHRVDGRIRLRIPRLICDAKFAQRLTDAVTALPAAKQVRVNRSSSSLLVSYRKEPSAAREWQRRRCRRRTPAKPGRVHSRGRQS